MGALKAVIEDFAATMDALRDFVSNVGPVLLQRREEAVNVAAPTMAISALTYFFTTPDCDMSGMPEAVKETIIKVREMLTAGAGDAPPEKIKGLRELLQKLTPVKVEDGKIELNPDHPRAADIFLHRRAIERTTKEVRLLYESSIMALASSSEWFVAQLIAFFYKKYPDAADTAEPFFNLSSLMSLTTLDDARDVIIEHKVETLMRKSFEDWLQFFKEKPKLGLGYLNELDRAAQISEVFKRRNLIVHNGGRVSRRYLREVGETLRCGTSLGDLVELTPDYLNRAINLIEHQFTLIAAELWKKLEPDDAERGSLLLSLQVEHLKGGRWAIARGLSYFSMNDSNSDELRRLSGRINYWQSFKWAGEYETIKNEVDKFDFSAKSPLFQLAHAAIRDDFDPFFRLLPTVLQSGALKKIDLATWPLFTNIRQRPEFELYKELEDHVQEPMLPSSEGEPPAGPMVN